MKHADGRRRPLAEINITPLVDVLLVLVGILLIAAPQMVTRLTVDVPQVALQGIPRVQSTLTLYMGKDGQVQVDQVPINVEDAIARIEKGVTTVEVAPSGEASTAQLMTLIGELTKGEPREIRLLARSGGK